MNQQIAQLVIAYVATAVPFFGALLLMRADRRAYFRGPVYSAMVMVLGVVLWNVARKHLPLEWNESHPALLYYGALTLYFVLGLAFGLLLGRLTGSGAGSANRQNSE
jgi:cytochrome c biogenesis protein CcdA